MYVLPDTLANLCCS